MKELANLLIVVREDSDEGSRQEHEEAVVVHETVLAEVLKTSN